MDRQIQNGMQCSEFETLLAEALETPAGLSAAVSGRFAAHRESCPVCGPIYADALAGMQALRSLEEAEPPAHLVRSIMLATVGREPEPAAAAQPAGWRERLGERFNLRPLLSTVMQPRFAMSFGMAFFSVSLLLNVLDVQLGDIRQIDPRPSAVRDYVVRTYHQTSASVVRYYENLRFVYEIETRVRDLKEAALPPEAEQQESQPEDRSSPERPELPDEQNRRQNYSREERGITVARSCAAASGCASDRRLA